MNQKGFTLSSSKGFAAIILLLLIIALILAAGFYLYLRQNSSKSKGSSLVVSTVEEKKVVYYTNPDWNVYVDKQYGFSFYYPSDWKIEKIPTQTISAGVNAVFDGKALKTTPLPPYLNRNYSIDFHIENPNDPNSPIGVSVTVQENPENWDIYKWITERNSGYSTEKTYITYINGKEAYDSKTDVNRFILIPVVKNGTSLMYSLDLGMNGAGSKRLYTEDEPFVKTQQQYFLNVVNSLQFEPIQTGRITDVNKLLTSEISNVPVYPGSTFIRKVHIYGASSPHALPDDLITITEYLKKGEDYLQDADLYIWETTDKPDLVNSWISANTPPTKFKIFVSSYSGKTRIILVNKY